MATGRQATHGVSPKATGVRRARPITTTGSIAAGGASPPEFNKLVFDTNRLWCAKLPALTRLFPDAKVICCVRDVNWIMDSIECLFRRNAFEPSGMFGYESGGTVFSRIGSVASSDGLVG